jgi:hypothetical protein
MQRGSMTVGQIMESVESDQFGLPLAQAWGCECVGARLDREDGGYTGSRSPMSTSPALPVSVNMR